MSDFQNDDFDFEAATIRARNIKYLLKDYKEKRDSTKFSLKTLCSHVSKIIPFSDPFCIFHWSGVARRAILSDIAENRPSSAIGGTPPASLLVNEDSPIFIFPPNKGKGIQSERQNSIPDSPLPPLPNVPITSSSHAFTNPSFSASSFPSSFQQHTPLQSGSRSNFPTFSNLPPIFNKEHTLPPIRSLPEKSFKRVHIDEPIISTSSREDVENLDSSSSRHKFKHSKHVHPSSHHKSSKAISDSSSNSSKSSSGSDPEWVFKHGNTSINSELYKPSPSAVRLAKGIKSYKHKRSQAVKSFIHSGFKPSDFPAPLVSDLLQGKYIELKKIKGELLASSRGDRQTMSIGSNARGVEIMSKTSSAVINDQGEWLHYFEVFCETFKNAFPASCSDIEAYSKYITRQCFSNGRSANWICIAAYDDALRRTFADQTFSGFL